MAMRFEKDSAADKAAMGSGGGRQDDLESEGECDEAYFASTYRPLSNLPTPPMSSRDTSAAQSPRSELKDDDILDSDLLGPATHLANLLPPAASLTAPSVPFIQAMLSRAGLPVETLALAVCILDSLDSRFARKWRLSYPLSSFPSSSASFHHHHRKRHTLPVNSHDVSSPEHFHIDAVPPEVIVLAALVIAAKFMEDAPTPTQVYASAWGRSQWSCEEINFSERCIMENLNYRIVPLTDGEIIADAIADMKRAARTTCSKVEREKSGGGGGGGNGGGGGGEETQASHWRSMSSGAAVVGLGLQLTPLDTPTTTQKQEPIPDAFRRATLDEPGVLHLPDR